MEHSVKDVASFVQARVIGDDSVMLTGIASVRSASPGDLVFVEDLKNLRTASASRAAAVLAGDFAVGKTDSKPLILADQPRLAFARAAKMLHAAPVRTPGVHASASVDPTARLGQDISVEEGVVVRENAVIDRGTWLAAGTVIGADVTIGRDCELYPNVTVYPGVRLGNRVIVHAGAVLGSDGFGFVRDHATGHYEKFPQVGRLEIEDDVEIGANATIDRGALDVSRIGRGTKIDNLVHIGHNCQIGEDVVFAAQTGLSGSVVIEKNVVIGGQVGIADHVRIKQGAVLGAQSGVPTRKVIRGKGVVFWGTPARPLREYLKEIAVLRRLARREK